MRLRPSSLGGLVATRIKPSTVADASAAAVKAGTFALDLETSGTERNARIYSISIAVPGSVFWLPLRGEHALPYMETIRQLHASVLSNPDLSMVAHNAKGDAEWLALAGATVECHLICTLVGAWLQDEEATIKDGLSLGALAKRRLGKRLKEFEDFEQGQQLFRAKDPLEEKGVADARVTLALWYDIEEELKKDPALYRWFMDVEMPLVRVIMEMEETGVVADTAWLVEESRRLEKEVMAAALKVRDIAGHAINVGSTEQVSHFLFIEAGLKPKKFMSDNPQLWALSKRGSDGQTLWRTGEDVLAEYAGEHPAADAVLAYRKVAKEKSTYVDATLARAMEDPENRIRTDFKQARMTTGRISSADPNLQNLSKKMRRMFVAGPGKVFIAGDFNQVELRILAHISGDVALRSAYIEGKDLHTMTQQALGLEDRRVAKVINFGIPYGVTPPTLQQTLFVDEGIRETLENCEKWIEGMFRKYPGIRTYTRWIEGQALKNGYVKTLFGRYRRIGDSLKKNRGHALRQAVNAPIQGTAADICKIAMRNTYRGVRERMKENPVWGGFRQVIQVHDQIVAEVPEELAEQGLKFLVDTMESATQLSVPLVAEAGVGKTWSDAEKDADRRKDAKKAARKAASGIVG